MIESNATSVISRDAPISSQIAFAISTSIPTISFPSWYSYGANSALVDIIRVFPANALSPASAASLPSAASAVVSSFSSAAAVVSAGLEEHAANDAAIAVAIAIAANFFFIINSSSFLFAAFVFLCSKYEYSYFYYCI